MRELAYEEGPGSSCFVALTYILEPPTLGEQKSKAAQLGIKQLMQCGIQPDIIACRASNPVNEKARQKISVYSNVPFERVISVPDSASIYMIPAMLRDNGLDFEVLRLLQDRGPDQPAPRAQGLGPSGATSSDKIGTAKHEVTIGITGKYTSVRDSYASIINALEHAGIALGCDVKIKWIETTSVTDNNVAASSGTWTASSCRAASAPAGAEGKIACIQYARENNLPYLGLCFGFQMAVIEFARNVCGLKGANSTEIDPSCPEPVIDILPEQKKIEGLGGNMRLGGRDIKTDSPRRWPGSYSGRRTPSRMRFRHRYEVDPRYIETLEKAGLVFSGKAPDQPIMQILELPCHPFFIGTQAHPCLTSRPLAAPADVRRLAGSSNKTTPQK